ncbi:MAG: hypothetical protein QOD75_1164 [Blastocatellia bacterium]|nr:hypothetical protein [Blastocatellia bacterium]
MRRLIIFITTVIVASLVVMGQSQTYTNDKVDYSLELPSATWKVIVEPEGAHQHAEFIYGERTDGYLRIRKEAIEPGLTVSEFGRRDQEQKVRYLPGYIDGKEERFAGRLNGVTISYEFTQAGKPMEGRTYYLQADSHTIYALRFTGARAKLGRIRNQTDLIARSFQLK